MAFASIINPSILCCSILSCTLLLVSLSDGQQVTCENPAAWVGVPEAEYNMSYASINDPAGRPLGFNRSTIPYRDSGSPAPCITIGNDINNRRIEVMAESNPPDNVVCVSRKGLQDLCDPVRIYLCEQTTGNSVRYTFYCPAQSCTDQDVPFLFRFTVSPPASEGDPELWCDNRETDQYPSTLTPVCPQCVKITPPPATTPSGSPNVGYHRVLLVAAGCVTVFLALL